MRNRLSLIAALAAAAMLPFLYFSIPETADAQPRSNAERSGSAVLGFDMWCQEIEALPATRCDMHRADDLKSYQQYRAMVERFQQERDAKARKEQEFTQKLRSDPTATARGGLGPAP